MTQIEKDLLLKDLSARLPYKVNCVFHSKKGDIPATLTSLDYERGIVYIKPIGQSSVYCYFVEEDATPIPYPYLRPMDSMTDEEKDEYYSFMEKDEYGFPSDFINKNKINEYTSWVLSHHFDINHLIYKRLALEAPEGMYKV